ncbi:MAG TPA: cytochrome c oxidase subunit 3 [Tepidisphaeraceae bacterium]|nr:cytochrome c oxidase subunit 3 [Tepidisphaeraceae bacterium]
MSSISTNLGDPNDGHGHGHGGHAHSHNPFLAHHFDTPEQQFTTGKLGMWVFLGTELLMFGGLFCAYAVYRHNHPEVFMYAHTYLDKWWGAVNTVVLLVSSFTMAWGVRAAQLGQKGLLCVLLVLTLLGGAGFMVIKGIEYKAKWEHHLFPGRLNVYNKDYAGPEKPGEAHDTHGAAGVSHGAAAAQGHDHAHDTGVAGKPVVEHANLATGAEAAPRSEGAETAPQAPKPGEHAEVAAMAKPVDGPKIPVSFFDPNSLGAASDAAKIVPKSGGPAGLAASEAAHGHAAHMAYGDLPARDKVRVNTFFSIYFMMTGLHGVHVVVGMGLIAWILIKGATGIFGPSYYTPVDLVGLYWHLVDLIWIFLFPLLYLIH